MPTHKPSQAAHGLPIATTLTLNFGGPAAPPPHHGVLAAILTHAAGAALAHGALVGLAHLLRLWRP